MRVTVTEATEVAVDLLERAGVPHGSAEIQADLLVTAEAKGVPSHGLLRLPRLLRRITNGVANPTTQGRRRWISPGHLAVAGEQGLGPVVAQAALNHAKPVAKELGVVLVTIADANHLGMLSWYTEQLAADGLVTIAATTSEALVHPWGGASAVLGTNPLSIAVPAERPVVLDMATSQVSMGKIHDYAARGEPLEEGWALDAHGQPTTDAEAARDGALSPHGVKGYALGVTLGAFVANLTGTATGTAVRGTLDDTEPANKGDVFVLIDAGETPIDSFLDEIRNSRPVRPDQPITVPGDRSSLRRQQAQHAGLTIADDLWEELLAWPPAAQAQIS